MNVWPGYQRGDRVTLDGTADPHTRLQPADKGTATSYDPRRGQLNVRWDSGSTLAMLLADGDQVRLITPGPEHPAPAGSLTAEAADLGRDAGRAAASWMFDGNTPEDAYRAVLGGIDDGDPAILDAYPIPGLHADGGYSEADLASDLGLDGENQLPPDVVTAYLHAAAGAFWDETERIAREHLTGTAAGSR